MSQQSTDDNAKDTQSILSRVSNARDGRLIALGLALLLLASSLVLIAQARPISEDENFANGTAENWDGTDIENVGYTNDYSLYEAGSNDEYGGISIRYDEFVYNATFNLNFRGSFNLVTVGDSRVVGFIAEGGDSNASLIVQDADSNFVVKSTGINVSDGWYNVEVKGDYPIYEMKAWNVNDTEPSDYQVQINASEEVPGFDPNVESQFRIASFGTGMEIYVDRYTVYGNTGVGDNLEGTVTNKTDGTGLEGATVSVYNSSTGNLTTSATTASDGTYSAWIPDNGTYDIEATKTNYTTDRNDSVYLETGVVETQDFALQPSQQSSGLDGPLFLDVRNYLKHGEDTSYTVTFNSSNATGRIDVTANATLNSSDTAVATVDESNATVIATSDTSVNDVTTLTAQYEDSDGILHTVEKNLTVANLTVDNIGILPLAQKFAASINDRTLQVIIISTAAGTAGTMLATPFAGVAVYMIMMSGAFFGGFISAGIMIVSILIGLFVGLNVANNVEIDYGR